MKTDSVGTYDIDIDDPSDWPSEYVQLREHEQLLRCPICKEYFATAMTTISCSHTFCSLCVRRCLTQETKCPSCRASLTESELYPNRLIDSLVLSFRSGREQLLEALCRKRNPITLEPRKRSKTANSVLNPTGTQQSRVRTRSQSTKAATNNCSILDHNNEDVSSTIENIVSDNDSNDQYIDLLEAPSTNGKSSDIDYDDNNDDDDDDKNDFSILHETQKRKARNGSHIQPVRVTCPNCKVNVRESSINRHLDSCLSGKLINADNNCRSQQQQQQQQDKTKTKGSFLMTFSKQPGLPRPTKLVYSLLSESKLRKTLKGLGIPHTGDKHQMQNRHSEWINMYLANEDSLSPISHKRLLKQLKEWESNLNKSNVGNIGGSKTTPQSGVSEGDINEHTVKYADTFADLIAQASSTRTKSKDA